MKIFSKIVFIVMLNLIIRPASSDSKICHPFLSHSEVDQLVTETRLKFFPHLADLKITLKEFKSCDYFLQARPVFKSLLRKKSLRKYIIQINPKLYDCPPSWDALQSILVHELEHINDYNQKSSLQMTKLGIKFSASRKYRAAYERSTDEKSLQKGLGEGLISYRNWIYAQLSRRELAKKKRYYFTPEEIREWMRVND